MLTMDAELTNAQWQIADVIARQMVLNGVDINEFQKTVTYLRSTVDRENAGENFFNYLKNLVRHGNTIGHSKRTVEYYRNINIICSECLTDYQHDAPRMLTLLCWTARLVKYYKEAVPIGELQIPEIKSEREAALEAVIADNAFRVGQVLDACVVGIKGNKVTYEIMGTIRLTQKQPKKLKENVLAKGKTIRIEIAAIRSDGAIKKISPII